MNPFESELFSKGYIKLPLGSYALWISKKWHMMFVRRGLVIKNFYNQYIIVGENLSVYLKWIRLYDKTQHDRDFPKSKRFLTEAEGLEIRREVY